MSQAQPLHDIRRELLKELRWWHVEAAGEFEDAQEAGVSLAALDRGDVVEMHTCPRGKLLLRELPLAAHAAHRTTKELECARHLSVPRLTLTGSSPHRVCDALHRIR